MITVLITCVGSGVGQSVIDSLNLVGGYKIIGADGIRNVYANSWCHDFVLIPSMYDADYTDVILNICLEKGVDVLVPGHDQELLIFSKNIEKFKANNIQVIVSEPTLIEISRNKQQWYNYFASVGCKIVPTLSVDEYRKNPDVSFLPAIVKPVGGSASQGIYIINDLSELEGLNGSDIIQPYLFPEESDDNYTAITEAVKKGNFLQKSEISIQLLFNKYSKFSGVFISKNTLKSGVPVFVTPIKPEEFRYLDEILKFVPVLENKGVKGPVNIQGRITPDGLYFFEMNMRFTGITGNRGLLGFNEVDFLIKNFLDRQENEKLEGFSFNKLGVRQVACSTIPKLNIQPDESTITILGGGSSIGRKFVNQCIDKYQRVNLIVRDVSYGKYQRLFHSDKIQILNFDDEHIQQELCRTDVFVNFASALAFEEDSSKFDAVRNVFSITQKLIKANVGVVINISSQSVYPQNENVKKNEEHAVNYKTAYSFQKVIIEDFFKAVSDQNPNSKIVSLRLPRVIVPEYTNNGVYGRLIEQYRKGETIEIANPLNNTNLIHVDDVLSAIDFVVHKSDLLNNYSVLNIAGDNLTLEEYCNKIMKVVDGTGVFVYQTTSEITASSMIDGTYFESLGWNKKHTVSSIIEDLTNQ